MHMHMYLHTETFVCMYVCMYVAAVHEWAVGAVVFSHEAMLPLVAS